MFREIKHVLQFINVFMQCLKFSKILSLNGHACTISYKNVKYAVCKHILGVLLTVRYHEKIDDLSNMHNLKMNYCD